MNTTIQYPQAHDSTVEELIDGRRVVRHTPDVEGDVTIKGCTIIDCTADTEPKE